MRSTKEEEEVSTDQINHEKYRKEVFLPYIERTRAYYLQREGWEPGIEVDDEYVWIGWQLRWCYCCWSLLLFVLVICIYQRHNHHTRFIVMYIYK